MAQVSVAVLQRALSRLQISLRYFDAARKDGNADLAELSRAAAIQAFEYTFELSQHVLRRHLAETSASQERIKEMAFSDLIRTGYARGLVSREWKHWHAFQRLRNLTSHTYSEECAAEVFAGIPDFVDEIGKLIAAIAQEPAR